MPRGEAVRRAGMRGHQPPVAQSCRVWPRSAELEDLKVHMVTATGDDTRRDGWGLTTQIKQAVGEHARREASYRTRRGLEGLARAARTAGGRSYGYCPARDEAGKKIRKIVPEEAQVVRQIF